MKKKLSKNTIFLLAAIVLNLAAIGAYYFGYSEIKRINQSVAEVLADIDVQTAKKADDRALKNILDSTRDDRAKIDTYLLTEDDIVGFIETIENLGATSHTAVTTSSVNVDNAGSAKGTGYLTMHITTLGTYENTMHFISLVENISHQVAISQLRTSLVDPGVDEKTAREWNSEFGLSVLMLKP